MKKVQRFYKYGINSGPVLRSLDEANLVDLSMVALTDELSIKYMSKLLWIGMQYSKIYKLLLTEYYFEDL